MVLATGNKSEYAAGYSTLYGDMCGGYAPLKDIWKVDVFRLCRWRNQVLPRGAAGPEGEIIPDRIIPNRQPLNYGQIRKTPTHYHLMNDWMRLWRPCAREWLILI